MSDARIEAAAKALFGLIPLKGVEEGYAIAKAVLAAADAATPTETPTMTIRVGIEVWPKDYPEPVRPLWLVATVETPCGEVGQEQWDTMTRSERSKFLDATLVEARLVEGTD